MKNIRVRTLLLMTILTTTVVPLIAAFYFLDHTIDLSLNLAFNPQITGTLDSAAQNLKVLKDSDPTNEPQYRDQFEEISNLKEIYSQPELVRGNLRESLRLYFAVGIIAAILLAVLIAGFLSRKIARAYRENFEALSRERERNRYLEDISSWQELAKILAHEIKNPLTPIEVLVTALPRAFSKKSPSDFAQQLEQTETMVREELGQLKAVVEKFSEFSRLPQVQLERTDLLSLLRGHTKLLAATFQDASPLFSIKSDIELVSANLDTVLFKQVLLNLVRNGIEANPGRKVTFAFDLHATLNGLVLNVGNDGALVPNAIADRIFEPYVSGKSGKDNMGLGLAVVKKIVLEHGGDIRYLEVKGRPVFEITLPHPEEGSVNV